MSKSGVSIVCPHCGAKIDEWYVHSWKGKLTVGSTSEKKRKSSRENGKKGGRPPSKNGSEEPLAILPLDVNIAR